LIENQKLPDHQNQKQKQNKSVSGGGRGVVGRWTDVDEVVSLLRLKPWGRTPRKRINWGLGANQGWSKTSTKKRKTKTNSQAVGGSKVPVVAIVRGSKKKEKKNTGGG